ncbi:circumsporozoite protein-like [Culex pipiens pallens]|uniref:circumsporozoite protein-like n=1 Tax=Culex pipiens pallens TaxID=42434 RepID=UPI001954AB80|nr:circumsporozoite protein-like [Culex pipiens pallens]
MSNPNDQRNKDGKRSIINVSTVDLFALLQSANNLGKAIKEHGLEAACTVPRRVSITAEFYDNLRACENDLKNLVANRQVRSTFLETCVTYLPYPVSYHDRRARPNKRTDGPERDVSRDRTDHSVERRHGGNGVLLPTTGGEVAEGVGSGGAGGGSAIQHGGGESAGAVAAVHHDGAGGSGVGGSGAGGNGVGGSGAGDGGAGDSGATDVSAIQHGGGGAGAVATVHHVGGGAGGVSAIHHGGGGAGGTAPIYGGIVGGAGGALAPNNGVNVGGNGGHFYQAGHSNWANYPTVENAQYAGYGAFPAPAPSPSPSPQVMQALLQLLYPANQYRY